MKKMMFNDRYGLTQAVIDGRKTVTRRIVSQPFFTLAWDERGDTLVYENDFGDFIDIRRSRYCPYKLGEVVAVAQRYGSFLHPNNGVIEHNYQTTACASKGWDNKMFVKADLMPHQIQIRDLRIERLQDISDDYFKEGITFLVSADDGRIQWGYADEHLRYYMFDSPREAFASLIDKVSGRGTWDRNPFVWRIEFQLVK
jgi:hypothetical protein